MEKAPPETPPGQQPDYMKVIDRNVERLSLDLEPFSVDERRRIMNVINRRVKIVETVPA